ncbi:MAG: hypothetical protein II920_10030, partial [Clostridia bacterium]|nr:hypothetical protein [Clostridia bacterium]
MIVKHSERRHFFKCLGCSREFTLQAGDYVFDCPYCGEQVRFLREKSDAPGIDKIYPFGIDEIELSHIVPQKILHIEKKYEIKHLISFHAAGTLYADISL